MTKREVYLYHGEELQAPPANEKKTSHILWESPPCLLITTYSPLTESRTNYGSRFRRTNQGDFGKDLVGLTISMESELEERPSSRARDIARSLTLHTCEASWEASFPFIAFSTSSSAFFLIVAAAISLSLKQCSLESGPEFDFRFGRHTKLSSTAFTFLPILKGQILINHLTSVFKTEPIRVTLPSWA